MFEKKVVIFVCFSFDMQLLLFYNNIVHWLKSGKKFGAILRRNIAICQNRGNPVGANLSPTRPAACGFVIISFTTTTITFTGFGRWRKCDVAGGHGVFLCRTVARVGVLDRGCSRGRRPSRVGIKKYFTKIIYKNSKFTSKSKLTSLWGLDCFS